MDTYLVHRIGSRILFPIQYIPIIPLSYLFANFISDIVSFILIIFLIESNILHLLDLVFLSCTLFFTDLYLQYLTFDRFLTKCF